ncbi:PAS domain S-box protein [Flavobacterium sp.]|uniref:PAS domain S-box protein n=1 Tax=Flavobacterium sp. TaxID=239 RepID=UPI003753A1DF
MKEKLNKDVERVQSALQEHLAAIVQSSDDTIISKSMDGIIIYWNVGAERIFNYSSKEIVKQYKKEHKY